MKLVIQIPCYNEEQSLPVTLAQLPKSIPGIDEIEVLVINDGSTDGTIAAACACGVKHFVHHPKNRGLAKAFVAGISKALELGADIIVNTDADNQYRAQDIAKLVIPLIRKEADIVIGARPISKIKHFSPLKKFLQKLGSFVMSFISSTRVEDATSGFRAFSRSAAMRLNIFDSYTYTLETIIQAKAKGMRLIYVPIGVNEDLRKSKLVKNMFDYVIRSTFTMMRMFVIYRPFRFFALIAAMFLVAGAVPGIRFLVLGGKGHIQSLILASILIITGVQVGLIAVLSELLSINRKLLEDIQGVNRTAVTQAGGKIGKV